MNITVGLTGASGSIIFKRTVEILTELGHNVYVIATDNGKQVFEYELEESFIEFVTKHKVQVEAINNMFSKLASGSSDIDGMIICPCSMGTIGNIANGTSNNLLIRASDVAIKERRKLVLGFREAPLSKIHLDNLQYLNECGAFIIPQTISFYNKRETLEEVIDDMVMRNLKYLGIELPDDIKWNN